MKNNRVAALLLGVALMVGVVVAEDASPGCVVLSNDTICAASTELTRTALSFFEVVKILQQNVDTGKTLSEENFLLCLKNVVAGLEIPVLSTLADGRDWLIGLNLLRTALDEWLITRKLFLPVNPVNNDFPAWLSEEFLKKAQQRFADDICSGKIQLIESRGILGADLLTKWLSLIDVQDSPEIQSRNVYVLLENFCAMLVRMVSLATINVNYEPGDCRGGVVLNLQDGLEVAQLVADWHNATSSMKFTKSEINLLVAFLTKFLPEEMSKMIAVSPLASLKPESNEEVCLCINYLFYLYQKIEFLFLDDHFPGQGFAGPVTDGQLVE